MGLFKKRVGTKETEPLDYTLYSPLTGKVVPLSEVNDLVFSQEMMGKGLAVLPTVGRVVAPCDGHIISVFRTLHALTIKADNGAEIIIHVGLETVGLDGKHYTAHVKDGAPIKKGDLLLTFELDEIKALGYDVVTPVIITNWSEYSQVDQTEENEVEDGTPLIELMK